MSETPEPLVQVARVTLAVILIPVGFLTAFILYDSADPAIDPSYVAIWALAAAYLALAWGSAAYGIWGVRSALALALLLLASVPPILVVAPFILSPSD